MLEYDSSKIFKAIDVIEQLRTYSATKTYEKYIDEHLEVTKKTFSTEPESFYSLGSTIPLTALSLSDALTDNPFDYFIGLVEKHHSPLDGKNVVEVGPGIYPIVSEKLLKRNPGISRIDVYDPLLMIGYPLDSRINLHPKPFNVSTPVEQGDLIISMQPCGGTFSLIGTIESRQLDSLVMLCTCDDASIYEGYYGSYNWHDEVEFSIKNSADQNFETGFFPTKYKEKATIPYFYTKRRFIDSELVEKNVLMKKES